LPGEAYWWDGLCVVDVFPSPKFQDLDEIVPVEVSVNCTLRGASPWSGVAEKFAAWASSDIDRCITGEYTWYYEL
jgi:hypothetical protein